MPLITPNIATNTALITIALTMLGFLIKQIGPWRRQVTEEEATFRADLRAENVALRIRLDKVEKTQRIKDAQHTAERSIDRHKLNNMQACFDATMLMLEMNPGKAAEVVVAIKAMRAAQMVAEAQEAAIIHAATIDALRKEDSTFDPHDSEVLAVAKHAAADAKAAALSTERTVVEINVNEAASK